MIIQLGIDPKKKQIVSHGIGKIAQNQIKVFVFCNDERGV